MLGPERMPRTEVPVVVEVRHPGGEAAGLDDRHQRDDHPQRRERAVPGGPGVEPGRQPSGNPAAEGRDEGGDGNESQGRDEAFRVKEVHDDRGAEPGDGGDAGSAPPGPGQDPDQRDRHRGECERPGGQRGPLGAEGPQQRGQRVGPGDRADQRRRAGHRAARRPRPARLRINLGEVRCLGHGVALPICCYTNQSV